jgi:O-antigen ligase
MFFSNKNKIDRTFLILFATFPISILIGNFTINLSILFTGSLFIFKLYQSKIDFSEYKTSFYLLFFFLITLLVNLFFSSDYSLSYQRVVKTFFIIFFILSFRYLVLNHQNSLFSVYRFWCLIFLIVIIDLIIEFLLGKNIFGQSSIMSGRLGSFTGKESVIGGFFLGFCLVFLSYTHKKLRKYNIDIIVIVLLVTISFLIGERSNFIRFFIAISIFVLFIFKYGYKKKLLIIFSSLLLIILTLTFSKYYYKLRYVEQLELIFKKNGLSKYLEDSQYGAHRNVAKEIFIDNPIFGVGIKNFRIASANPKYDNLNHKKNHLRVSNHPHEIYYEFLSETGIFGLSTFLIFISISLVLSFKNYLINRNIYQLSGLIIVVLSILPIIPAGSFLSTYSSSIFWINYALMMGYNNVNKIKF